MTIAQKPPLTVGIDDEIRSEPKLFEAVQIASRQLEEFLEAERFEFERYEVRWSRNRRSPDEISAEYTEQDRYGERHARLSIPVSHLFDPVSRDGALRQLRI